MDALTLLREARAAGLHLRTDDDKLVVEGPKTAAPIVERLRQHKADILAALQGRCSCARCVAGAVILPDGRGRGPLVATGRGDGRDGELLPLLRRSRALRGASVSAVRGNGDMRGRRVPGAERLAILVDAIATSAPSAVQESRYPTRGSASYTSTARFRLMVYPAPVSRGDI